MARDSPLYVGHHEPSRQYHVSHETLQHLNNSNFDFLTSSITNDAFHSRVLSALSSYFASLDSGNEPATNIEGQQDIEPLPFISSLTPQDTDLRPDSSLPQIVLTTSAWIDLASPDPVIALVSQQVLKLEVEYATFCGAVNIIVQVPQLNSSSIVCQYARFVKDALEVNGFLQIHIGMHMASRSEDDSTTFANLGGFARDAFVSNMASTDVAKDNLSNWDSWNLMRSLCNYNARLGLVLTLPQKPSASEIVSRWLSEPVRIVEIPGAAFVSNGPGEPRLPAWHQSVLARFMNLKIPPWILLSNTGPLPGLEKILKSSPSSSNTTAANSSDWPSLSQDPTPAEAFSQSKSNSARPEPSAAPYIRFMRWFENNQPERPPLERFGAGYQDYLQNPLQPLTDNLESITYEVFEKDPVKYDWYERAITSALVDWVRQGKPVSGLEGRVVIAIVGAGRGPLVSRALSASTEAGVKVDVWAVEKNPNAYLHLLRHNVESWSKRVRVVQSDMRTWTGPARSSGAKYKVDILVSELLGSFADNELSPECLDGVQHVLAPRHGISIPASYTAHITPVAAPKLHQEILARTAAGEPDASQIPYVVMLQSIDYLCSSTSSTPEQIASLATANTTYTPAPPNIQQVWSFAHPSPPKILARRGPTLHGNEHNRRFTQLRFPCRHRGVCHGLAGYFETVLYSPSIPPDSKDHPAPSQANKKDGQTHKSSTSSTSSPGPALAQKGLNPHWQPEIVELSTNPLTMEAKSRDMISWFPIYFPLRTPLAVPDSATLVLDLWRQTDGRRVWYEWMVEVLVGVEGGKQTSVGCSELHSSYKSGCLM